MLTEFALTPSIFDAALHPDAGEWQEQLRELGQGMFPRVAASPVIVSNLHGGAWEGVAGGTIARLRDPRVRNLCQGLLTRLAAAFVRRPVRGGTPGTELQWAQAALAFRAEEPIERIVVTEAAKADTLADEASVFSLRHVNDEAFWTGISSAGPQEMVVATQVGRLSKLCKHADFLLLVSKDIHGGDDDETRFAVELIRSALSRPPGFDVPEVEVHTQGPDRDPKSATLRRIVSNVGQSLRAVLLPGQQVRLVMWAKLLDRLVIAGSNTRGSAGKTTRRPRWGVAMSHIARPGDVRKGHPPTNWSLLQSADLGEKFARYGATGDPNLATSGAIR